MFIPTWEVNLGTSRTAISFVYSLALVSLTFAVLLGHRFYRHCTAPQVFLLVGAGSYLGLWVCSISNHIGVIYLAYGCLFGFANGLGYGYTLQLAGQSTERHHAISMSLVTAFYAVGAALASQYFHNVINSTGIAAALQTGGSVVAVVCLTAAIICAITRASLRLQTETSSLEDIQTRLKITLWLLYGSSVTAGLMIIGHALPIYATKHPDVANAAVAPTVVAVGNIAGGLCIGLATLKLRHRTLLLTFSLLSLTGLILISQQIIHRPGITLSGLSLIGFSYGATIAVFPVVVADLFGKLSAPKIYGQVFTAWGLAGLLAPTLSGVLFDRMESYGPSIVIALIVCIGSVFLIPRHVN